MKNSLENYKWFEHSRYWLDDETYNKALSANARNIPIGELISKHKIIKNIRNFVDIINNEGSSKINVVFQGQQAHTDGKTLTISSDVTDFDLLAGLSLHEASHLMYSKDHFRILGKLKVVFEGQRNPDPYTSDEEFKFVAKLYYYINNMKVKDHVKVLSYICLLGNFIEDARVDSKVINRYPGYEPYYDALDRKYILNPETMNRLLSLQGETFQNYLSKILLLNVPDADLTVLKGLQEIADTIDIENIDRLKGGMDVFELSFEVFKIIEKYVEKEKQNKSQDGDGDESEEESQSKESQKSKSSSKSSKSNDGEQGAPNLDDDENDSDSEPNESNNKNEEENEDEETKEETNENGSNGGDENEDDDTEDVGKNDASEDGDTEPEDETVDESENDEPEKTEHEDEEFELSDGSEALEQLIDALNNEYEKEDLTEDESAAMDMITNQSIFTKTVQHNGLSVDTILIKDASDAKLIKRFGMEYLFSPTDYHRAAVKRGINKGKLLAKRLSVMNDVKQIDSIRKKAGRLDNRLLPEFGHGNTKIFKTSTTGKYQDTNIHITIDNSGSMSGTEFSEALEMAAMFGTAALYIKGLEVQISVRSTMGTIINDDTPYVAILFDSKINDIKHIKKYLGSVNTTGLTPEGLTFAVIKDYIISNSQTKNSFFINISDGFPSCDGFHGEDAIEFTAEQVKDLVKSGIMVISFLVGSRLGSKNEQFEKMYGKYAYTTDIVQPLKVANIFNKNIKKA